MAQLPHHFHWLNFNKLTTILVFTAIFVMAIRYPMGHDSWWHLRSGQLMVESGTLISADPFSHTQTGQPWINHGWLGQLFWYGLFATGGWAGLSLGLALVVTLSFWLTWQQAAANLYLKAFLLIVAAIPASIIWSIRPQMLSFLLTALTSWFLYRYKYHGASLLPWLPLITVVWVNTHGGFAIAFIIMLAYLVGECFNALTARPDTTSSFVGWPQWRHLLVTFVICLMVVTINPHTWRMWLYPFQTVGIGVLRDFIAEWQSPNFHQPIIQPFLLLLLLTLAALARSGSTLDWSELALVGGWVTLSLFAVRNVPIFVLVCAPILIRQIHAALEDQFGPLTLGRSRRYAKSIYWVNWALLGLIGLGALAQIIITLSPAAMQMGEQQRFPTEAVRFVQRTQPPAPIFNSYNVGGYLLYHLWPAYPVFVDGRTDLYNDAFLRAYLITIKALPGWQDHLDQHNIQTVIIEAQSPLAFALAETAGWQQQFANEQVIIFERQD